MLAKSESNKIPAVPEKRRKLKIITSSARLELLMASQEFG